MNVSSLILVPYIYYILYIYLFKWKENAHSLVNMKCDR
jgi:succinate dehydrogenase hydrophobic anchor subunit